LRERSSFMLVFTGAVLLNILLSACTTGALSIDVTLSLYMRENWKIQIDLVYSRQEIQFVGPQIEQWLASSVAEWQAQDIHASYNRKVLDDGIVSYQISASGQGFAKLNAAFFDNLATIASDEETKQITFTYLPVGEFFSAALSRTFSLSGGEIINSNGVQEDSNTVTWLNPVNVMTATLKPGVHPGPLVGFLVGVLVLLMAVISISRRAGKKRCFNCGAPMPRKAEFCTECGVEV